MTKQSLSIGIVVAALLLGGFWLVNSRTSESTFIEGTPRVVLASDSHDWGEIGIRDGDVRAVYSLTNSGDGSLVLSDGRTSCGCTTARLTAAHDASPLFGMHQGNNFDVTVNPGESAELEVIFDPLFHGPQGLGPITRQVTLRTNDPSHPTLAVDATAVVVAQVSAHASPVPDVSLMPATQDLGTVVYGDVPTTTFTLANNSDTPLTITQITTSCSCTTAEAATMIVQPGSTTPITVAFNPAIHKDDTDLGALTRTIFVETDHQEFPKLSVTITATVIKQ